MRRVVVVAPHPDDETLGFGATAAAAAGRGIPVQVVSVSDGGAAHPEATAAQRMALDADPARRSALRRGGSGHGAPMRLGLPDGDLAAHEDAARRRTRRGAGRRPGGIWCAATWRGDGHPDHEAVGRAAAEATARTGAVLTGVSGVDVALGRAGRRRGAVAPGPPMLR